VLVSKLFQPSAADSCVNCAAARTLFPPTKVCTNANCPKEGCKLRRKDDPHKVILFTLSEGACATYSVHLICHGVLHLIGNLL
jgi:hypothetical protein